MTIGGHHHRSRERIAEEIRNEVGLMLAGELKDPRLAVPLSVTEVRVGSRHAHRARICADSKETSGANARTLAGLKAAAGYVRHELVERLRLRRAPESFSSSMNRKSTASTSTSFCEKRITRRNRSGPAAR